MLAVSADRRQGVWAVRFRRGTQRKWRFAFLGLRFVEFSDGEQLIGFSSGCPCPSSDSSRLRAQLDCCDRPASVRDWLPAERMCSCCTQLLTTHGGEAAVRLLLRISAPGDSSSIVKLVTFGGTCYQAVRAGDSFADWGILDSKRRCCTCPARRHICDHVHEVLPDTADGSGQTEMSAEAFETKLQACFDLEAGSRRLDCVSKLQLPEQLEDDAALLQLITGGRSMSFPCWSSFWKFEACRSGRS